ncbi:family 20 glycosylhydrolase [Paucibacter sp. XJ19-41]|uniref:family 20 glycosylhydrolase n=1 Tax=Paucibacter sp. XJ19-41 TaxID=2927824 RepID=UPI00234B02FC|nr:family 20 glycosylhydrolase [Paucibacter sp. XJ19-41]MDC6168735.1 family 20 glycosylhydrolase [Paucibacter sp. XJ19-41]
MPWPRELRWLDRLLVSDSDSDSGPELPATRATLRRIADSGGLTLLLDTPDDGAPPPPPGMDERYRLAVRESGIVLHAATVFGALRGLQTLSQLRAGDGKTCPCVEIIDAPAYPWRGLLIDVVRRWLPLAVLKRQLDGMAAAKLNVLHWHLTDDQGWRLASARYPRLQSHAGGGQCYSLEEARELVAYASERGIRVVPELDVPGHTTALAAAYPELFSAPGPYEIERGFGVFKPCLDPRKPEVYEFLDHILAEWATVFPDPFVHIGGDEVEGSHWQALGLAPRAAQALFNRRLLEILARHGKTMLGWDELGEDEALPAEVMLQSWRGPDSLARLARRGHAVLLSAGFYLDQPHASAYHWRRSILPPAAPQLRCRAGELARHWRLHLDLGVQQLRAELALIEDKAGQWRGWIAFEGQAPLALQTLAWRGAELCFGLDTWMGELSARLHEEASSARLQGVIRIANVLYPAEGEALYAPDQPSAAPAPLDEAALARVRGAEAALWSELVDAHNIDLRLWPRLFAVAERFWSAAPPPGEAAMLQRLDAVSQWAVRELGLQHEAQHRQGLLALVDGDERALAELQRLVCLIEPAGYYARQHRKKLSGRYHLDEPLNRLADVLPAENRLMQELARAPVDLARWRALLAEDWGGLPALLRGYAGLAALLPLAERLPGLRVLGLELLDAVEQGQVLPEPRRRAAQQTLDAAAPMVDEVVLALVPALESLLEACS